MHRHRQRGLHRTSGVRPISSAFRHALRLLLLPITACGLLLLAPSSDGARAAGGDVKPYSEEQGRQDFQRSEDVLKFINDYSENKTPEKVAQAVHAMARLGLIKDPEQSAIYIGFIAGVIGDNQVNAERLIASMFPMTPVHQVSLIKAIAYSGLPDWKELLGKFVERMPARKVLINHYLYGKGKTLDQLDLSQGGFALDVNWGYYFATGSYVPGQRIISALRWAQEKNDVDKLTAGSMAKWTLATNASRDKRLLDLCKSELNHVKPAVRKELREIIEAAELFETGRIRKEALANIERLRIKGPKRTSDWKYYGKAGTTVLALGCVVAGALGQAYLGLPCVVGGALSQAAVNLWTPE